MNKPVVVGMISSYPGLNPCPVDWLWKQTPEAFGVWKQMQMLAPAKTPDFLLMYQFEFHRLLPRQKQSWLARQKQSWLARLRGAPSVQQVDIASQLRGVDSERIIYLMREPPLDEVVNKNKTNYLEASKYCGYISGPDEFAPTPDYMPAIWYHANSWSELNDMSPPQKVRKVSWITSGVARTANHRQRLEFLRLVQESGLGCDLYGRNLPEWINSGGEVKNKWHSMAPYYYNLAIENYAQNDLYVSEKLWDSLLAWCLPIYYGGEAADKLLPPGSFLRLPSLDEKGLAYIQEAIATPDAWEEAKGAIAEARQIILHKLNLLNWLSEFIAQFS